MWFRFGLWRSVEIICGRKGINILAVFSGFRNLAEKSE